MRKAVVALLVATLVVAGGLFAASRLVSVPAIVAAPPAPCADATATTVAGRAVPKGPVAGFCAPELAMAATILQAARDQGVGQYGETIGVMTAIGESGLRNLDYGDVAGPDSRGLFQQRDNGAWGTLADRMDPYTAATNFFRKLARLPGWQSMTPTEAAHAVQVNADPGYYAQYWGDAQTVVGALGG